MERTSKDVEAFLAALEGRSGDDIRLLDAAITERMSPEHARHLYEGTFWGGTDQQIVGYGVMDTTNDSGGQVPWFIVGLAVQKHHLSLYVNAVDGDVPILREYEKKLGNAKVGAASVAFESVDDLDFGNLMEMIDRALA
jgi:hypothetical protein